MYDQEVASAIRAVREQLRIANRIQVAKYLAHTDQGRVVSGRIWTEVIHDLGIVVNPSA
jgi:hypothetical protein